MNRLTAFFFAGAIACAQGPKPPTGPGAGAADGTATNSVIRIDVNLVQVDAVVTDSRGRRVTNLPATAFEILQDGKPQAITNFTYVSAKPVSPKAGEGTDAAQSIAQTKPGSIKPSKGEVPPPPVALEPTEVRRTLALMVDDLGLSAESIPAVRVAIRNFIDQQMRPGDLVAIVRTSAGMGALQQFTTDKRLLYAALDRVKYGESRVGVSSFAPLGSGVRGRGAYADATVNHQREDTFAMGSLGAIRFVVNAMKDFPGRKSVVLFTENIRLIFRGATDEMVADAVQQLSDAASRASVVIHAIDPRGMQDFNITPADDTSGMSGRRRRAVPARREAEMINTQEGSFILAEETGGLFLQNTNDLASALRKAAEDSDGYYLIGYHPDANTFENSNGQPKFHKVDIKLKGTGLHVRSREGFFGEPGSGGRTLEHTREAELTHALQSPFSAGSIHPRLTAVFSNQPKTGSVINALLYFNPNELKWTSEPDGSHKASVDVAAAAFDENGLALAPVDTTFNMQVNAEKYPEVMKNGMVYGLHISVHRPGPYVVRAALRDPATEGSGSAEQYVEVPDIESGHLALSGIVFQGVGAVGTSAGARADGPQTPAQDPSPGEDATGGAARRIFRRGAALFYAYDVMNAMLNKSGASQHPELEVQTRLFHGGVQVRTDKATLDSAGAASDPQRVRVDGRMTLGGDLTPGEYALQVIVTDKLAKGKFSTVTQSMDFEIEP
jgi:VWFA-related protein